MKYILKMNDYTTMTSRTSKIEATTHFQALCMAQEMARLACNEDGSREFSLIIPETKRVIAISSPNYKDSYFNIKWDMFV